MATLNFRAYWLILELIHSHIIVIYVLLRFYSVLPLRLWILWAHDAPCLPRCARGQHATGPRASPWSHEFWGRPCSDETTHHTFLWISQHRWDVEFDEIWHIWHIWHMSIIWVILDWILSWPGFLFLLPSWTSWVFLGKPSGGQEW